MRIADMLTDVPHPGVFIADELEARGWLQRDLAYILGVPEQAVNMIISGKRGISPEMSKAMGEAFDVSSSFFSNLQTAYEMSRARLPDPAIRRRALFQGAYPVREMIKRGWLADTDVELLEGQLMRFFQRNNVNDIPYLAHAAKKTGDYSEAETSPAQLAWLFRVKQICSEMVVGPYSERALRDAVQNTLPRLMLDPEETRHVPRVLAECGVRFAIVETLPKALIDGVCFWLDKKSPVIGMTTRYDRIDNFWFVLRHEIEHALNGDGRGCAEEDVTVDVALETESEGALPPEEVKANAAAQDFCAPIGELESFILRKAPYISEQDVKGFARRIGRHPGIVIGQIQHRLGRPELLNKLKVKVRHHVAPAAVVDGWGVPASVAL